MNEQFVIFVFAIGIGAVILAILRHNWLLAQRLDDMYERVARRWGGKSLPGGFLGRPAITFYFAGAPAKVDIYSTGGKHPRYYTQIQFGWLDAELRCEIYPEQFYHGVGKLLGMQDLQIGSPEFDHRYLINGNSDDAIRRLLNGQVQRAIEDLRQFLGNDDIYVSIRAGRLLIKKRTLIRDEGTLERFIRLGTSLHEAASNTSTEGIEFVNADAREAHLSLDSAICQVCGDDIKLDAVFCRSCKTPHHRDCWQYYGSCSTYGCGQTNYLVEKKPKSFGARAVKRQP